MVSFNVSIESKHFSFRSLKSKCVGCDFNLHLSPSLSNIVDKCVVLFAVDERTKNVQTRIWFPPTQKRVRDGTNDHLCVLFCIWMKFWTNSDACKSSKDFSFVSSSVARWKYTKIWMAKKIFYNFLMRTFVSNVGIKSNQTKMNADERRYFTLFVTVSLLLISIVVTVRTTTAIAKFLILK